LRRLNKYSRESGNYSQIHISDSINNSVQYGTVSIMPDRNSDAMWH
jgi:hypothetical protein